MTTKKKLMLSICSLCAMVVLSVFTIAAIFAAESQNIKSQIEITYKATNVSATINGDYLLKTDAGYTSMGPAIEFLPSDKTETRTMGIAGAELSEIKNYAILRYQFINNSNSVSIDVIPKSEFRNEINVTVTYLTSQSEVTDFDTILTSTLNPFTIPQSETMYVYVKIAVKDLYDDAIFSGSFNFDLNKTK